jgi:hypothetical protein
LGFEKGSLREVRRRADMQVNGWGVSSWRRKEKDITGAADQSWVGDIDIYKC